MTQPESIRLLGGGEGGGLLYYGPFLWHDDDTAQVTLAIKNARTLLGQKTNSFRSPRASLSNLRVNVFL